VFIRGRIRSIRAQAKTNPVWRLTAVWSSVRLWWRQVTSHPVWRQADTRVRIRLLWAHFGFKTRVGVVIAAAMATNIALLEDPFHQGESGVFMTVRNTSVAPRYDFTKTQAQIMRIDSGRKPDPHEHGLTRYDLVTRLSIGYREESSPGAVRLIITDVRYEIGYKEFEVYVDRRYAEGTCQRREVLEHENEHVAHAVNAFRTAFPAVKAAVEGAAVAGPVIELTMLAARKAGTSRIEAAANAAMAPAMAERERLDDLIDSQASYAALSARCGEW
jgi:hypothetical protein